MNGEFELPVEVAREFYLAAFWKLQKGVVDHAASSFARRHFLQVTASGRIVHVSRLRLSARGVFAHHGDIFIPS